MASRLAAARDFAPDLFGTVDALAARVNGLLEAVFFWDVVFWSDSVHLPLVVLWLGFGAAFCTVYMGFINVRGFSHAVQVVLGRFTSREDQGEVSHFQALTTALSATVGLGNIAGVSIAISVGGPGATFWMIVAGFLGMSAKFAECTLALQFREVRPDGRIMGGAMEYLSKGLGGAGWPRLGRGLAIAFSVLCVGGSLGGGNGFQVNQSLHAVGETVPYFREEPWAYGLLMVVLVGLVILGGIRRIARVADKIVPVMGLLYLVVALFTVGTHYERIPEAAWAIVRGAFQPDAAFGGALGVLVVGFQRAAFSNEAGAGSAAIAHSAAKTPYPVREGIVALLEPFIDTILICTVTALVIVITGAYDNPAYAELRAAKQGAALTSRAMGEVSPVFPYLLALAVFLFAYSTMISWSYYGERCWAWLFGDRSSGLFRAVFLAATFAGAVLGSTNVLAFGDLMILGMAFPNLLGVLLLRRNVRRDLDDYWQRLRTGSLRPASATLAGPPPVSPDAPIEARSVGSD
jgi:AGCS family alanine or glycine:cation symporter